MTSRETILAAVRANLPSPAPALPEIPLSKEPQDRCWTNSKKRWCGWVESSWTNEAVKTLTNSSGRSSRRRG